MANRTRLFLNPRRVAGRLAQLALQPQVGKALGRLALPLKQERDQARLALLLVFLQIWCQE